MMAGHYQGPGARIAPNHGCHAILRPHASDRRTPPDAGDGPGQRVLRRVRVRVRQDPARPASRSWSSRGTTRARLLIGITRQLDAYLSASQLGITVASLSLGWLGEPAVARLLRPVLSDMGVESDVTVHTVATAISLTIITFLHTVIGEQAPKALALQTAEPVALWTAVPLRIFYTLTFPFIWLLNGASSLVLRLLRPAARVGGRDVALAGRAAAGPPARAAGPGRAPAHRPRVRLHPPRGPPRDDVAARRRDADRRACRSTTTCASRWPTSTRVTRWSSPGPTASSATSTSRTSSARWRRASGPRSDARAGARAHLRLRGHAPRVAAPRVPAPARAHRDHPGPGPHVRRHRHAGGPAGGGHGRDPGRAGHRRDPAHRPQQRRQHSRSTGG